MPIRKSHPYAKGCEEPQAVTDARTASQIFGDLSLMDQEALQTYFLAVQSGAMPLGLSGGSGFGAFADAEALTGGPLTGGEITADGVYRMSPGAGQYILTIHVGSAGGGTIRAEASCDLPEAGEDSFVIDDIAGNAISSINASGAYVFYFGSQYLDITMSGSTNPQVAIFLNRIS